MSLPISRDLKAQIDLAVNPQGQLPKTTGPGLNAVLTSMAEVIDNQINNAEGGQFRGPWAAVTAYAAFDVVVQKGVLYYAPAAHTSGTSFVASTWAAASPATTDNVPEGHRNLYYRGDRAVSDVYTLLETTVYPFSSVKLSQERRLYARPEPQDTRTSDALRLLGGGSFQLSLATEPTPDYTLFYCLRVPLTEPAATVSVAGGTLDGQDSLVVQPGEWRLVGLDGDGLAGAYHTMLSGGGSGSGGVAEQTLEFVFEAGFADEMTRTMGARQAGTYASEQRQNVASASYYLNGSPTPAALPLTLAATDTLRVALTRTEASQAAMVTLLS